MLADIPVRSAVPATAADPFGGSCAASESYALMVLGDSMLPEFEHGDIIIIEPDGLVLDRSFVIAQWQEEWLFSQLIDDAGWCLRPLNRAFPEVRIPDLTPIKGVIIQKSKPGRRRAGKRYVD
jgi:SOS-response transcriptional repressor LexA